MKKYLLLTLFVFFAFYINAQTINVHFKNGTKIQYPSENVDYVDFSLKAEDPTVSEGKIIDLGLSVYWASCNLGALSPEESGNYYSWGETSPKSDYGSDNYSFYDDNHKQYIDIGDDIAGTQFDAARVNLGGSWQMPTSTQVKELIDSCEWEWTQINNINGYKVIGKNGNSIFLPAAGEYLNTQISGAGKEGRYYTSDLYSLNWSVGTISWNVQLSKWTSFRYSGMTIRPVTSNLND